jgi:MoxR-like ATPase
MLNKQLFQKISLLSLVTFLSLGHGLGHAAVATYQSSYTTQEEAVKIDGMAGKFPYIIQEFIDMLKESSTNNTSEEDFCGENTLLFYGPRGNGKTTLAKKIATVSQSEMERFKLSCLGLAADRIRRQTEEVKSSEPDAVSKIKAAFTEAIEYTKNSSNTAVILIDEIDYVAEDRALLGLIREGIDNVKNNPKIAVIATTNKDPKELDSAFQSRFSARCQIKMDNPSAQLRKEVLRFYWLKLHKDVPVDETLLELAANKSNELPIRALRELITHFSAELKIAPTGTLSGPILLKSLAIAQKAEADQRAYEQALKDAIKNKDNLTPGQKVTLAGTVVGGISISVELAKTETGQKVIVYTAEKAYKLYEILKGLI